MKYLIYILIILPITLFAQSESEPNGSFTTANTLVFGETLTGFIGESEDEEYFILPVVEAGIIRVRITGVPGIDYRSFIYLSDMVTQIFTRTSTAEGNALEYEISTCGMADHFLYISDEFGNGGNLGSAFNTEVAYNLTVDFTPFSAVDSCECDNETILDACLVEPNETQSALIAPYFRRVGNSSTHDDDWYKVIVTEPAVVRFNMMQVPAGLDLDLQVIAPDQSTQVLFRTAPLGTGYSVEFSACETGEYYFFVEDSNGFEGRDFNSETPYTFEIELFPFAGVDECECENETIEDACEINSGQIVSALIAAPYTISPTVRDRDVYYIDIEDPSTLELELINEPGDLDLNFTLTAPNQSDVLIDRTGGVIDNFGYEVSLCETGRYYLSVRNNNSRWDSEETYRFRVNVLPFAGRDDCECDNETITDACEIVSGEVVSALIGPNFNYEETDRDRDAYFVEVTEPSIIKMALINEPNNLDLNFTLTAPDEIDVLLDRTGGGIDNFGFDASVCEPGRYYLSVRNNNNNFSSEEAYRFRVTVSPFGENDRWECDNNSVSSARQINLCDTVVALAGPRMDYEPSTPEADYYKVNLEGGNDYRVLLRNVANNLNLRVEIRDVNESVVFTRSQCNGTAINEFFTPGTNGDYTVKVFDPSNRYNCEQPYILQVGCNQTTNLTEYFNLSPANLYPNPLDNDLTVGLDGLGLSNPTILLIDLQGRTLIRKQVIPGLHHLDLSTTPPGIYFIRVLDENKQYTGRIVRK